MRYLLILLLILTGCGSAYKTQYYMHELNTIPVYTIDSINKVHNINIPLYFDNMQKTIFTGNTIYTMYHYAEYKKDTLFVFSVTIPKDEQRYIIKLRKELNK